MKYTIKAVNKGEGVTSYEIYDERGRDVGRAVRQGSQGVFQIRGHAPVKFTRNNVAAAVNDWAQQYKGWEPRSMVTKDRAIDMYKSNIDEGDVILHPRYKAQKERLEQQIADFMKLSSAGIDEDKLKRLAAFWWNNDESPAIEKLLARMGWEIGQDEGYDDEPGAFVVQIGDEDGHSFLSWSPDDLRNNVTEGDVVKHKFGLKQQQKNKTKYQFYQEIKDDIPVYDRGTHDFVLPQFIERHRFPENLEPFDHFTVEPSVSGVNGRILGITKDGMKVLVAAARIELAKVLADAYNRGGFSDKDIEKVTWGNTEESRCSSAALQGITEADREYESSWQKRYKTDPEFRERQKQNERNRRKNPEYAEKKREYQRERSRKLYADPDWRKEDLARRRDVYAANKDAVLAKRRKLMKDPAYVARKAEYWKQDAAKRKELTQKFQQLVQDPDFDPGKLPTAELKKFIKFLEKGRV